MRKILFVSSQFPNSVQPQVGVFSLQIVRELAKRAEIKVVAPVPTLGWFNFAGSLKRYNTDLDIPAEETIEGITVYHPRYLALPGMGFTHHLGLQASLAPLLRQIGAGWPIAAINCHWLFPDGVAVQRVAEKLGIPVMLTALGCDLNRYPRLPLRRKNITGALQRAEKVSVLNTEMYRTCLSLGVSERQVCIIKNGVNLESFAIRDRHRCRSRLGMGGDERIIVFVGSLVEVKNVATLLQAFHLLRMRRSDTTLVLVGSGYLEKQLRERAKALGIEGTVRFAGQVPHESLVDWINLADCFCLPSLREGHPNVMMEALACGVPVVASRLGSIPDFVSEGNGLLISDPLDAAEIAGQLDRCLSTRYDREAIRQTVAECSWSGCAERYLEELQRLYRHQ